MENRWVVAKATVIGNGHMKENIPCQDAHAYKFFHEDNFAIAVVSDGAGSAEFSQIGSKIVVEQAIEKFSILVQENNFVLQAPEFPFWRQKCVETFNSIFIYLQEIALREHIDYKSLAATAIIVILTPYGLLTTHIGDGRAGYLDGQGEWHACIKPFKGELANETVFITSDFWRKENIEDFIESRVILDVVTAFTLLSDGCENVCFQLNQFNEELQTYERINKPFPGFYGHNINTLVQMSKQELSEIEIDLLWEQFLIKGNEQFIHERDDKTLILGVKLQ